VILTKESKNIIMNIEEEDIFNFIYNPVGMDETKHNFIKKNSSDFSNEINFYKQLKEQQNIPVPNKIIDNIIDKINSYNLPQTTSTDEGLSSEQKSAKNNFGNHVNFERTKEFAANSYIDDNSNFIVRIEHSGDSSYIYLTNKENSPIKNYSITINQTKEEFFKEDNSEPIIINRKIGIEDIRLSFK